MSVSWITVNSKLQEGVALINSLSMKDFTLLLQYVTQSKQENTVTQEQVTELKESLGFNSNNWQLLVQSIAHIFNQSSKVIIKPTVLQKQLTEDLKFNTDKAEEFIKIWTNTTKEQFENLENRLKLDKISWELNLQTSSSSTTSKQAVPNVRMKLGLSNTKGTEQENVVFELKEAELLQFYNTLESIQNKLDFIQQSQK